MFIDAHTCDVQNTEQSYWFHSSFLGKGFYHHKQTNKNTKLLRFKQRSFFGLQLTSEEPLQGRMLKLSVFGCFWY